jgi:transposase
MDVNPKQRRRHSAEFKAQVLAACTEPGASVAAVALAFRLNDNLVHQWRRGREAAGVAREASAGLAKAPHQFIELAVAASGPAPSPSPSPSPSVAAAEVIRLEFKRGALGVVVTWPVSAAAGCAAWLREVLG